MSGSVPSVTSEPTTNALTPELPPVRVAPLKSATVWLPVMLASITGSHTVADFKGATLTGGSSGVKALVVGSDVTDGTDPDTLYVKYLDSGTSKIETSFTDGETLQGTSTINGTATTVICVANTTATGSAASIVAGVYYINGFYVSVDDQTIILDKYTNTPSYRVGQLYNLVYLYICPI